MKKSTFSLNKKNKSYIIFSAVIPKIRYIIGEVNNVGKYQLDTKGQVSVSKYHEKNMPEKLDKNQKLKEIREKYLKNKKKTDK